MKKTNSVYINIFDYANPDYPFQIFVGGRGLGKSYSALKGSLDKSVVPDKFIFMRRTKEELKTLLDDEKKGEGANPYKPINRDLGVNYGLRKIGENVAGVYLREEDPITHKITHLGAPVGYGLALTTIAAIRGIDFSDCSDWFYDEFIKERHVRAIKEEGEALLNAYETINRNREFDGKPPIRLWLLANSNDIYNPIFQTLGIVSEVERMIRAGKEHRYFKDRGLAIHLLKASESFVDKKKETALYKLTKGTRFYDMALDNKFAYNDFSLIGRRPIVQYTPICSVANTAYIYRKKGENEIYVSYAAAKCINYSVSEAQDEIRFRREQGVWLHEYYVKRKICFESYELKEMLLDLIM